MIDKIARVGVMGFVSIAVVLLFAFLVVASVLDVPGVQQLDADTKKTVFTTLINLVVGVGGIAIGALKGGSSNDPPTPPAPPAPPTGGN